MEEENANGRTILWRVTTVEKRVDSLEAGHTGPSLVINEKLNTLAREVRGIKWVFGIFTGAFVSGVISLVLFVITGGS